ncbi:hypothetical protein O7607_27480 [Micromonospora sp. WMMA1949]|uniref:hypothetical protein n=1 Tax=Micromonospora sp. WMMA1949 TaxID=3015162 RepID=UPI0022B6896F|nr:hypothetical protein [Micromonospora sp. WMMA1949]MCZ7429506.1 hypothetical protein [Micromonospora sp. WMMA1949]
MHITRHIAPAVRGTPVEFNAESERGLELGGNTDGNRVLRREAGELPYLLCEIRFMWDASQQALTG